MLRRCAILCLTLQQQPRRAAAIAATATAGLVRRSPCTPLCRSGMLCAALTQRWASSSSNPPSPRRLPDDECNFESIRKEQMAYVDKTAYAWKIANREPFKRRHLLFIRPRRFGKSMLLRTLKAYYEGRKDLFAGLEAARLEETKPAEDRWAQHPVIYLDLGSVSGASVEEMKSDLYYKVESAARKHNLKIDEGRSCHSAFEWLIEELGKKCEEKRPLPVVLIDEYDMVVHHCHGQENEKEVLGSYATFLNVLKVVKKSTHAAFLTGIVYCQFGWDSALNHLLPVTFEEELAAACGFTEQEITDNFSAHLKAMATALQVDKEVLRKQLKSYYNGYKFCASAGGATVYNPFSIVRALRSKEIAPYWAAQGNSSALTNLFKRWDLRKMEEDASARLKDLNEPIKDIACCSVEHYLLYTGYLTIQTQPADRGPSTEACQGAVSLGFPNAEVKIAVGALWLQRVYNRDLAVASHDLKQLWSAAKEVDVVKMTDLFWQFIASCTTQSRTAVYKRESYYQGTLFNFCRVLNLSGIDSEQHQARGRVDLYFSLGSVEYIVELKMMPGNLQKAIKQVCGYTGKFTPGEPSKRTVRLVIRFSSKLRNIHDWYQVDDEGKTVLSITDEQRKRFHNKKKK